MAVETYTVEQIAEQLGVSVRTIREYVRDGKIKAVKVGNKYIISEDNFRDFVNGGTNVMNNITLGMVISNALNTSDKEFEIKDLFNGQIWEQEDPNNRRQLGRQFKEEVENGNINGVSIKEVRSDNHTIYIKHS
ncbi:helix-turn-helix domain-containing protein [Staphylococcus cohnii]|uniref:helix-turn-helix domain-containing protein n=1 Tax=Staphylococcus cohnii TaxID=29382 RepID=UPI003AD2E388